MAPQPIFAVLSSVHIKSQGQAVTIFPQGWLGKSELRYGNYVVNDECFGGTANSGWEYACCAHATTSKTCPKGWGNQRDYNTFLPGCFEDSYYPHPTPASATDIYTGSLYGDKCLEPYLINENQKLDDLNSNWYNQSNKRLHD